MRNNTIVIDVTTLESTHGEEEKNTVVQLKEEEIFENGCDYTVVINKQSSVENIDDLTCDELKELEYCSSCHRTLEDDFVPSCTSCFEMNKKLKETKNEQIRTTTTTTTTSNTQQEIIKCQHCNNEGVLQPLSTTDNIQQLKICTTDDPTVAVTNLQASPNKSINTERMCRICLDNVDEGDLIAPCKCSGSTKYAHESCLLKWFFKSSKKSCEVCLGNVNVTPVGYKPVQQWRLPESGCDFIVYLFGLYFLIMVIFTGMITWIATQGCTSPVCVTLYCVCGIAVFYFFYCCGCVEYSRRYWKSLLSVNKVWRIYGREDSIKNFKHNVKPRIQHQQPMNFQAPSLEENINNIRPFVIDMCEPSTNLPKLDYNIKTNESESRHVIGIDNYAAELEEAESES